MRLLKKWRAKFVVFLIMIGLSISIASYPAKATCTAGFLFLPQASKTFSGTNCTINAFVTTDVGYVTNATIYIDGQPTKSIPTNTDPTKTRIDFTVNWDSTHFTHGSSVQLLVVGHNNIGQEGRSNRIFLDKIYNKGSVFCRSEFEESLDTYEEPMPTLSTIRDHMIAMHYEITTAADHDWTRQQVLNSAKVDSILYYSTHGTMTTMLDDLDNVVTTSQMSSAVANRTAPADAKINLVFFNGCQTMTNTNHDWQVAFSIPDNPINRAYLGWDNEVDIEGGQCAGTTFWDCMRYKNKVTQAKVSTQQAYDNNRHERYPATLTIGGDPKTKLSDVYEGSGWFR
ncbi:MAG: hypothetical protein IT210_02230 [Armatimonadetes bacterium]|nr:hypothetical protein [Armatimonadota bacterium]